MQEERVSYCKKEIMSMCKADNGKQQKKCCFYEKSNSSERCMYYVFESYCDCLQAQVNAT